MTESQADMLLNEIRMISGSLSDIASNSHNLDMVCQAILTREKDRQTQEREAKKDEAELKEEIPF